MKVMFITQEDPIYVGEFWDEFSKNINQLSPNIEITSMVSLMPLGKNNKIDLFNRVYNMYGFIGTFKVGIKFLKSKVEKKDLNYYCKKMNINYVSTNKIHSKDFLEKASTHDLIISVAASRIFKKSLINSPKFGIVNIHSGPLPYYKGMMPVFWQMRDGNKEIGITIHSVNEEIDSGRIYKQEFVDISDIKKLDEAIRYTKRKGANLMMDFLNNFESYYNNSEEMKKEGTYFTFPKRKDTKKFKRNGYKLI
ncbi:Formyl transferase [Geotoga petraea]|uniref:Formyl transferase n=2 Tax=Geotoga petraea TaxID=28234 RepID=A0A1G6PJ19_9BACT|nr:Formyl transferase [Geotoga petraea]